MKAKRLRSLVRTIEYSASVDSKEAKSAQIEVYALSTVSCHLATKRLSYFLVRKSTDFKSICGSCQICKVYIKTLKTETIRIYYAERFALCASDLKKTWSIIKELLNSKG